MSKQLNIVEKKVKLTNDDVIRFQLITHCFINNISLSENDIDCLTILAKSGIQELSYFCSIIPREVFKSAQTVRNSINRAHKSGLVIKTEGSRKTVSINPDLKLQITGNILLDFKLLYLEPKEG